MNLDKCKLIITNHKENVSLEIDQNIIPAEKSVKLLGVIIDNGLNFDEHVSKLCKKASVKLHALSRISYYLSTHKLRVIMKAFIESQFGYCPLIWMFHSIKLNHRINKIHERALRLVYKNPHISFEELLAKDNTFTIHERNLQRLAIEMYKRINDISPSILNEVFPLSSNTHNLRYKNPFNVINVYSVHQGTETVKYRGPKTWELVPLEMKELKPLSRFVTAIKTWKPIGCTCRLCKTYIAGFGFLTS